MDNNTQTFLWIVAGAATILFLVATAMSYRTWRWHALVLLPLIFIAAGFYFVYAVQLLRIHQKWREADNALTANLAEIQRTNHDLEFGIEQQGRVVKAGVEQLRQKLVTMVLDRGRVWVNCQPTAVDPGTGEIKLDVPDPNPNQIKKGMNLYAFDDRGYLGELLVTSVAGEAGPAEEAAPDAAPAAGSADAKAAAPDAKAAAPGDKAAPGSKTPPGDKPAAPGDKAAGVAKAAAPVESKDKGPAAATKDQAAPAEGGKGASSITLVPSWQYLPRELQRLKTSLGTWTLYDKMPVDGHVVFADVDKDPIDGSRLVDLGTGKPVTREDWLKKRLPAMSVDEYFKDLQPAGPTDPPERVAVKVQFVKDFELPALPGAPGSEPRKFARGAEVWLLRSTVKNLSGAEIPGADDLAKQGIVKLVPGEKPRYERALRDYAYWFDALYLDRWQLAAKSDTLTRQTADVETVYDQNVGLTKTDEAEKARLLSDQSHYQIDMAALKKHLDALTQQYAGLRDRLRRVVLENWALAARIDAYQRRAAAEIDRRAPAQPEANLLSPAGSTLPTGS